MQQAPRATLKSPAAEALAAGKAPTRRSMRKQSRAAAGSRVGGGASAASAALSAEGARKPSAAQSTTTERSFVSVLRKVTAPEAEVSRAGRKKDAAPETTTSRPDAPKRRAEKTLAVARRAESATELSVPSTGVADFAAANAYDPARRIEGKAAARAQGVAQIQKEGAAGTAGSRRVAVSADSAPPGPKMLVLDLRNHEASAAQPEKGRAASRKSRPAETDAVSSSDRGVSHRGATALVLAPRSTERSGDVRFPTARIEDSSGSTRSAAAKTVSQPSAPGRFSEILRDEVVRHASVVMRNGGDGEIRLVLRPESLGEVRIRMKVVDDSIEGRIVVQNAEARALFQENLDTLEAALREQGFQNASLDVSVSDGDRRRPEAEASMPAASRSLAAEELERTGKVVLMSDFGMHAVDMVV